LVGRGLRFATEVIVDGNTFTIIRKREMYYDLTTLEK
jgi:hypothetical protein